MNAPQLTNRYAVDQDGVADRMSIAVPDYVGVASTPPVDYPAYDYQNPKIEHVLARLDNVSQPDPNVPQYTTCCPSHHDMTPSFSIGVTVDGKLVFTCHASCKFNQIYEALGRPPLDGYTVSTSADAAITTEGHEPVTASTSVASLVEILDRVAGPPYTNAAGAAKDWPERLNCFQTQADASVLTDIAQELGVEASTLRSLGVICDAHGKLTYPEFDGSGCVCGIATRERTGEKRMVTGSHRGIYISTALRELSGPIYCCEGLSDTAALLTMGLAAVGRPSATGGNTYLADFLRTFPADRRIIVLGEMDAKSDGRWPGKEGAETIAQQLSDLLHREVAVALPPDGAKDVRAWLQRQRRNDGEAA